ncbi:MAG: formate dehydrogenase accessory sulfurtransferase FdhD [Thermoanaerobacterales bacterium]|nr:formate dehydrogenase accessory sulfurtransferase FdhD [Thermoanaerobacterales bacterium]
MNLTSTVEIIRGKGDEFTKEKDIVIREFPLKIIVNEQELVTLVCTPRNLDELAVGYLFGEGLIKNKDDIQKIELTGSDINFNLAKNMQLLKERRNLIITSSSGKVSANMDIKNFNLELDDTKVAYKYKYEMADVLSTSSELFKGTGGVHSALLCDFTNKFTVFREDIGRHNAVDKIVGYMILNQISPQAKVLVISGMISSEILLKTARCGVSILVSRSAPTDLAINLANQLGITVIGFVRGQRMNIYSHADMIIT